MRLKALASGSNGNSIFIDDGDTPVLIDAGISCKRICDGLKELDVDPRELKGILITHEHSDHIQGLRIFEKKYHIPIFATNGTLEEIRLKDTAHEIEEELYHPVVPGEILKLHSLRIRPIRTFHDAKDPVAFRVESRDKALAVMTDTGTYSEEMVSALQGLDGILLEANHDIRMLEAGSYPYVLKRRILGDYGHLSNERSGSLLTRLLNDHMDFCLLGHLSEENNYPELALLSVKNEVDLSDTAFKSGDFKIDVATRTAPSLLYQV